MFKCKTCDSLMIQLSTAMDEMREMRKASEREREAWARERESLLTRIQAWTPNPEGHVPAPSQEGAQHETVDGVYTEEELHALGLEQNSEGGYLDMTLSPPVLYETVEDCLEVRAFLQKQNLPRGTHPGLLTEGGLGQVVELARQAAKNGKTQEEDGA